VSIVVDILLLQTVSIAIASAGVFVAAIYYIFQIRNQSKIRELDTIIRMNVSFSLNLIEWQQATLKVLNLQFKDYDDFVKKYGSLTTETPTLMAVYMISNYTEGVGYLLKRKLVSINYVWDTFGLTAIMFWEKLKPVIEGLRKEYNSPTSFEPFEYLYNEMKRREQKLQQSKD
jgi:hypothetical protein